MTTIQISVLIPLIDLAGLLVRVASMVKGSTPAVLTRQSGADRSNDRVDHTVMCTGCFSSEPGMCRVADEIAHRMDRLNAISNGKFPVVAASAFKLFSEGR